MQINSSESVHLYPLPVKNRWTFRLLNFFCKSMTCELLNSLFCLLLQHQYYSYKVEKKENGWNKSRNRTQDPQTPTVQKVTTHTYIKSPNSIFSTRLCSKSSMYKAFYHIQSKSIISYIVGYMLYDILFKIIAGITQELGGCTEVICS